MPYFNRERYAKIIQERLVNSVGYHESDDRIEFMKGANVAIAYALTLMNDEHDNYQMMMKSQKQDIEKLNGELQALARAMKALNRYLI